MKKIALFAAIFAAFGALVFVAPSFAEDPLGLSHGRSSGLGDGDVRDTAASIINIGLTLLGTIALVLVIYAGFLWMTAGGNEDQVGKAKSILGAAVIGLVIILSAYSITKFITMKGFEATQGPGIEYGAIPE
jgi:hypothetical protein